MASENDVIRECKIIIESIVNDAKSMSEIIEQELDIFENLFHGNGAV